MMAASMRGAGGSRCMPDSLALAPYAAWVTHFMPSCCCQPLQVEQWAEAPCQVLLLADAVLWTRSACDALRQMEGGNSRALRSLEEAAVLRLEKVSAVLREQGRRQQPGIVPSGPEARTSSPWHGATSAVQGAAGCNHRDVQVLVTGHSTDAAEAQQPADDPTVPSLPGKGPLAGAGRPGTPDCAMQVHTHAP